MSSEAIHDPSVHLCDVACRHLQMTHDLDEVGLSAGAGVGQPPAMGPWQHQVIAAMPDLGRDPARRKGGAGVVRGHRATKFWTMRTLTGGTSEVGDTTA
ncbi:MAG TPA: hypothetical protein VNF75_01880 [Candidatus Dormibacteraeota bacterium]|nr:hypothetical protein [Candidatus Dormibacteraeota bacterium]